MTAQTPAQRKAAERQRHKQAGRAEVRGIYAHPDDHSALRKRADQLATARSRAEATARRKQKINDDWTAKGFAAVCVGCGAERGLHTVAGACPNGSGMFRDTADDATTIRAAAAKAAAARAKKEPKK